MGMLSRPAPLFSTRGRARGVGFTGNGAFQCFRVLGVPDAHLGRKWPRPGLGRWVRTGVRRVARDSVLPHPPRPLGGGHRAGLLCPFCGVSNTTLPCRGVSRLAFRGPTPGHQDMLSQCFRAGSSSADCHWDTRFPVIASYASTSAGRSISCRHMPARGLSPGSGRA